MAFPMQFYSKVIVFWNFCLLVLFFAEFELLHGVSQQTSAYKLPTLQISA